MNVRVKFKDAELIGLPIHLVVGRGAAEAQVELGSHMLAVSGEMKRIGMTAQEAVNYVIEQIRRDKH